jgi:hypothetical protein
VGETATATVGEIEETRRRLDAELHELEAYLPAGVRWAKRAVGVLVGGGVVTTVALFLLRRRRKASGTRRLRDIERRLARVETELTDPWPVARGRARA